MVSPYNVIKLREGFWTIEEGMVRTFLIEGSTHALLIDTGLGGGNLREVVESLTSKPLSVVITHADRDHVGANAQFDKIHMHPSEFDYYFSKQPDANRNVVPVWEGHVFDLGSVRYEVILIPGHTPGSIALLDRENREMFGGDSLQSSNIFMFGPGRNLLALEHSLNKLLAIKDSVDAVYASHGNIKEPPEVITNVLEGINLIKSGAVEGKEVKEPFVCKLYDCGKSKFLLP